MDESSGALTNCDSVRLVENEEVRRLIELAKTERDAIAQLYRMHYHIVAAYVHRRVSNAEDANDVISEVFVAMVKELPGFRWKGVPFCIWLYRIATYKISRWARQRRVVVLGQFDDQPAKALDVPDHIDPEFIAMAMDSLPIKFQDVLSLHYFEGLSIIEISAVIKRSPGTVKSRLHTGRALMRQLLEQRGIHFE